MADKMPDYLIEIKRLELHIQTQALNIKRNELAVLELEAEIEKRKENNMAYAKDIEEAKLKLKGLRGEHRQED